jgi:transcriptional regulator with GAF, ATPase, and Fis domain
MMVVENVIEYKDVWWIGHGINADIRNIHIEGLSGIYITVTMGISRFPINANTYEDLLRIADKAFYRGKMKGRNCFIIYLDEKHKNINLKAERDTRLSSTFLCSKVFQYLTETDSLEENIGNLFKHFVSYYMFDHVCIETEEGMNFETIHLLSKYKQFEHIPSHVLGSAFGNSGIVHINSIEMVDDTMHGEFIERLKAQNVSAVLYCEISYAGKIYGYLRADMSDKSRIWQASEMDVLVVAANTIAVMLHYRQEMLSQFKMRQPVIIGETA